jgi:hypothetical protein
VGSKIAQAVFIQKCPELANANQFQSGPFRKLFSLSRDCSGYRDWHISGNTEQYARAEVALAWLNLQVSIRPSAQLPPAVVLGLCSNVCTQA